MNAEIDGYWRNHIDGRQVDASDGGRITVHDPATGRALAEVAKATPADVDRAVAAARRVAASRAAVGIANGTRYGLAAGVFTDDLGTAMWCTERLEAGQVRVNEWGIGGCETPFGGFRHSGIGREKGLEGLRSYHRSKNVGIRRLPHPRPA